jgi:DNA-binding ferritin-like protein
MKVLLKFKQNTVRKFAKLRNLNEEDETDRIDLVHSVLKEYAPILNRMRNEIFQFDEMKDIFLESLFRLIAEKELS